MTLLSAIVLSKNEEKNITRCLTSLQWCDEIIVIDDNSSDKTKEIAEKLNAKVYEHPLQNDFSQQRQYGIDKANGDWILFVDADEEVSVSLQYEITNHLANQFNKYAGFYVRRVDEIWGKKINHGEVGNTEILRLAKRNSWQWNSKVHEFWKMKVKGETTTLKNPLYHYPHQNIASFLYKINFYSDLQSKEFLHNHKKIYSWQILIYPIGKFIMNYIFRFGFLDGIGGFVIATMMSFHSFLVRSKTWNYQKHT